MSGSYKRSEILTKCEEALFEPQFFYKEPIVNYRGITSDTAKPYTEVIAEFLLNNLNDFKIQQVTRESSYYTVGHDGKYDEKSNREEEKIAMQLFKQKQVKGLGKILDYQVPLKNSRDDSAGKIDLLAYNGETLEILELKKPDSKETMLRCVLEGYTYLKVVDQKKLVEDFKELEVPEGTPVAARPLVFKDSEPYREWLQLEKRPMLKELMKQLNSEPLFLGNDRALPYRILGK